MTRRARLTDMAVPSLLGSVSRGKRLPSTVPRGCDNEAMPSDPWDEDDLEVRRIQPFEARKTYTCPGCSQQITPGTGHIVAVPPEAPDLRRHWHTPCWHHRARR